jgi:hypothetical protein
VERAVRSRGATLLLAEGRILWAEPRPGLQEEQLAAIYLGSARRAVAATVRKKRSDA